MRASSHLMQSGTRSNPIVYLFLVLPYGICSGLCSITLPFALVRAGFSVAAAASIVALGLSANLWRFAGSPIVDLTLSLRRWYLLGLAACLTTSLVLGVMPLRGNSAVLLTFFAFLAQVGSNLLIIPVGGFIAHTVTDDAKGRAAGWYQAGNLGGNGLGGGAGVWLVSHYSFVAASVVLAGMMLIGALALRFVPDVVPLKGEKIGQRTRKMGRDLFDLIRTPIGLLTTILVTSAIGSGGMNNVWSSVASDWRVDDNTVALVTGVLNGVLSAIGCIAGGWMIDRIGRWWAYFGSGILLGVVAIAMAVAPRNPTAFSTWVLCYAFACGMAYAAFSAIILLAIGRGAASTKYALLSSFGNVPVIYMTAVDGWSHDRFGSAGMLLIEAAAGIICVFVGLAAVATLRRTGAIAR